MEEGEAEGGSPRFSWESLPRLVLGRCLRATPPREEDSLTEEEFAAFCTCKAFAEALLASGPKTRISLDLHGRSKASFKPLVALLRWAAPCCATLRMDLFGASARVRTSSLRPLLDQLRRRKHCLTLPMLTSIHCYSVVLDSRPGSLAAVCPNLQQLDLYTCAIPAGTLPLAGCTHLTQLVAKEIYIHDEREDWLSRLRRRLFGRHPLADQSATWLHQLQQLASLPTLTSLGIGDNVISASLLPLMSAQLTDLELFRTWDDGPDTGRWSAALAAAAQCTNLRQLQLAPCSAEQLGPLTTLTQLQRLVMPDWSESVAERGGLVSTLLRFPHLTSLNLFQLGVPQQSYANSPCSWKELELFAAAPQLLARLPLHSLAQPLQYNRLQLDQPNLTVADMHAATDNLARCGQVPRLRRQLWSRHNNMGITFGKDAAAAQPSTQAALLRAAAPLLPLGIDDLSVGYAAWDAGMVLALRQAVPYHIPRISIWDCSVARSFWPQLAHSFPQLKQLQLRNTKGPCSAAAVMSYFRTACARHAASGQPGAPHAADIKFTVTGHYGQWYDQWQDTMQGVQGAVEALGLQAKVVIDE